MRAASEWMPARCTHRGGIEYGGKAHRPPHLSGNPAFSDLFVLTATSFAELVCVHSIGCGVFRSRSPFTSEDFNWLLLRTVSPGTWVDVFAELESAMAKDTEGTIYRAGELAPVSGIYRVTHLSGHRKPHLAVIIRAEELPVCRTCKGNVRFEIVQMASHVTHDWDFTAPSGLSVRYAPAEYANVREFPRHTIALAIEVERPGKPVMLRGQTADVSESGLCALLDEKLDTKDGLVSIRIATRASDPPISTAALMRYRAGKRHGFLFIDMDANAREMVRSMLTAARSATHS